MPATTTTRTTAMQKKAIHCDANNRGGCSWRMMAMMTIMMNNDDEDKDDNHDDNHDDNLTEKNVKITPRAKKATQ